jgi:hypothetical protein
MVVVRQPFEKNADFCFKFKDVRAGFQAGARVFGVFACQTASSVFASFAD